MFTFDMDTRHFERVFSYEDMLGSVFEYLATIGGMLSFIFWSFAATVDYAICKRFKKKYLIGW